MTSKRFFFIMAGVVVGTCALIIATAVVGNSLLKDQAAKLSELRAQNQVIDDQKIALIQGKKDIEKYSELDTIAKSVVPQDKDQARTVREINAIAARSGIQLQAITFTASNLGEAPAPVKKTEGTESTPTQPAAPAVSQVTPVEGIPGVFALQIAISPSAERPVSYQQFLDFLERLENNRRTAHVDNISVSPTEGTNGVTFTLTLNAYVKP